MTTLTNPAEISDWMINRKKYYYFAQFIGPIGPAGVALFVLYTQNAHWFWFTVLFFYFGSAILDLIFGKDTLNIRDEDEQALKDDGFYDKALVALVPMYIISFGIVAYVAINVADHWSQYAAALIGVGAMFAGVFCVGHELGHRTKDANLSFWARVAVSIYGYGHFHIEHNRGHHVQVATPEDAASARMGENVFEFMAREIPNTFKRAITLETERLSRLNLGFYSRENKILQGWAITLIIHLSLIALIGAAVIPFLLISIILGYFQLTMANFLEHYGLLRQKLDNGRYEKCEPRHSWNSNHLFTNMMTLQLQRHSDHHANASREFQILRDYEGVPELPAGYPFMQFLSVIPPLWRKIMDKKLLEFVEHDMDKVNVDPKKREMLYKKYHRPQQTA